MNSALEDLLRGLTKRPPGDVQALVELASARGMTLPSDYVDFMRKSDGGEGDVGLGYLEIWPAAKVLQMAAIESPVYEDFIAFAGDGANTVYGFDVAADGKIVEGDWIGLGRDELIPRGRDLAEFLLSIAEAG